MNGYRKIALLFNMRTGIQRQVLRGISRFAVGLPHWHWRGALPVAAIKSQLLTWKPDGIIGSIENPALVQVIRQLGLPAVDMSNCLADPQCARVGVDDEHIGRLAAEYFLAHDFKSFGYVDGVNLWFSEVRGRSYMKVLREAGFPCAVIRIHDAEKAAHPSPFWIMENSQLRQWLHGLPKPVAVPQ